ncbi:hypothetical protein SECTIM467_111 [Brevibacillus phage SecTim467]|uniref:Uncharacterized protein n=2 Tax=Jenstvirus jenst TaxID=1982225 RepID=A0A0K2CPB6_9CAUD|nr:hypothetical protein AVV11_gp085 [Brevibacillus phage Jenst]ALA07235.1 hypothetical protein JENST_106 [Brevibacillus phage Jenst]ALA07450.1 hypothetical protein SECTIM467_111 [Brevibacillus phage SecTim467]
MPKLERKVVLRIGFLSATKSPIEMVVDIEPEQEKLEMLMEMNKADYIDIFTRLVPVEG